MLRDKGFFGTWVWAHLLESDCNRSTDRMIIARMNVESEVEFRWRHHMLKWQTEMA